jgi:hypothetical protein
MDAWFSQSLLATEAERRRYLAPLPAYYDQIDAAFHSYLTQILKNPTASDTQLESLLRQQKVEPYLAEECVVFAPLAWGRAIVAEFGISYSATYRLHSLISDQEQELKLDDEPVFIWATLMTRLYHIKKRDRVFRVVSVRSAEVQAIHAALKDGYRAEELLGWHFQAPHAYLRRGLLSV